MKYTEQRATEHASFDGLMLALAYAWNHGEGAKAASLFTSDAVCHGWSGQGFGHGASADETDDRGSVGGTDHPSSNGPLYQGREAIERLFVGRGDGPSVRMAWHHLAFDADAQVGFGEYSLEKFGRCHGVVVVRLRGGLIHHWREYRPAA